VYTHGLNVKYLNKKLDSNSKKILNGYLDNIEIALHIHNTYMVLKKGVSNHLLKLNYLTLKIIVDVRRDL